ncbi:MAG: ribonuclease III, partial [Undibacterium sp.]|nr:ribonuclease III [Undibacterium sp.]
VVATHGAAHNQEFEIECVVPKLEIQVFGAGGSRRAGEQAAAKLALETALAMLSKTPVARKGKPRTSQLKLAGIATVQTDVTQERKNSNLSKQNSLLDSSTSQVTLEKAAQHNLRPKTA